MGPTIQILITKLVELLGKEVLQKHSYLSRSALLCIFLRPQWYMKEVIIERPKSLRTLWRTEESDESHIHEVAHSVRAKMISATGR